MNIATRQEIKLRRTRRHTTQRHTQAMKSQRRNYLDLC